jgi:hypothetical protein
MGALRSSARPGQGPATPAAEPLRPRSKPRLRSPGRGQLRGLRIEPRGGSLPSPPHQALLQGEVPHVPGVTALLQQEHFLYGARIQTEPHSTQRSGGLRHPGGKRPDQARLPPCPEGQGFHPRSPMSSLRCLRPGSGKGRAPERRDREISQTSPSQNLGAHLVSARQVADLLPDPVVATCAGHRLTDVLQRPQLLRLGR